MEQDAFVHTQGDSIYMNASYTTTLEGNLVIFTTVEDRVLHDSAISLPGIYPREPPPTPAPYCAHGTDAQDRSWQHRSHQHQKETTN